MRPSLLFVLAENRCSGGFSPWPKQNPAASGGEVEEGGVGEGGGAGGGPAVQPDLKQIYSLAARLLLFRF